MRSAYDKMVDRYQYIASLIPFNPNARNGQEKTVTQIAFEKGNFAFLLFSLRMEPEV